MCPKCQDAKNKWFHRIVMGWDDINIDDVRKAFDEAFGEGAFAKVYNNGKVNFSVKFQCKHCGENFHIRS